MGIDLEMGAAVRERRQEGDRGRRHDPARHRELGHGVRDDQDQEDGGDVDIPRFGRLEIPQLASNQAGEGELQEYGNPCTQDGAADSPALVPAEGEQGRDEGEEHRRPPARQPDQTGQGGTHPKWDEARQ